MLRPSQALRGQTAVVMESAGGLGFLVAATLAQAGAAVVLGGREMATVEAAFEQLGALPGVEVIGGACDPHRAEEVEALAALALHRFGALDLWVNGASPVGDAAGLMASLLGTLHGTQAALRHMLPRNQGKLLTLVGRGARAGDPLPAGHAAFAAAQAGALRLTETLAAEHRASGLSILALAHDLPPDLLARAEAEPPSDPPATEALLAVAEEVVRLAGRATDGVTGRCYTVRTVQGSGLRRRLGGR